MLIYGVDKNRGHVQVDGDLLILILVAHPRIEVGLT